MASKTTNTVTLLEKTHLGLQVNKPFQFIIYSKTPLNKIICHGTKKYENLRLFSVKLLEMPYEKYFYNFTHELIATPQMQGGMKCHLYYSTNEKIEFVFPIDVNSNKGVPVSYSKMRDELLSLSQTGRQQTQYNANSEINTKYGEIAQKFSGPPIYQPSRSVYVRVPYPYSNADQDMPSYYNTIPEKQQTQNDVQPNANDIFISAPDNARLNSTQEAVYHRLSPKHDPGNETSEIISTTKKEHETKTEDKEFTLSMTTLVVVIAVVIGLVGIAAGVIVGTFCRRCCRKSKDQVPIVIYESRPPGEPMYEEVNQPAFIDMSSRPQHPLPPEQSAANKKYIHYDTPYDHRFDKPRVLRQCGNTQQLTTSSFRRI